MTAPLGVGLVAFAVVTALAAFALIALDNPPADPPPADTTQPAATSTAYIVANLPPPLTPVATTPATRGLQQQLTQPPTPPTTIAQPPAGADNCEQMHWWRAYVGLPARFDGIGWRESNCHNTVISRTGCCVGWLQLHEIIFRDHRMTGRLATCGATWHNVRGDTVDAKRRQMCAAKALFDVDGYTPWKATA